MQATVVTTHQKFQGEQGRESNNNSISLDLCKTMDLRDKESVRIQRKMPGMKCEK